MPSYIPADRKTRRLAIIALGVSVGVFLLGILFGYLAEHTRDSQFCSIYKAARTVCSRSPLDLPSKWRDYFRNYWYTTMPGDICLQKAESCHTFKLPRTYIAYHLGSRTITIDGNLDDDAWTEVPWSEYFVDMRSERYPKPRFDTRFKLRWDDSRLYMAAYVQDTDLWATNTQNDTALHKENGIEFLADVDGSLSNFKQVQANVLGTTYDLMHYHSYWDGGEYTAAWSAGIQHAINYSGTLNTPGDKDKSWSVEFSFLFSSLAQNSSRTSPKPSDDEVWFMQFGRSEYTLNVTANNTYVKDTTKPADWWSWQPCGAINLMLQDRWGLVQFKRNLANKDFLFTKWHIYRALFDVHDALKKYQAVNGKLTDRLEELQIPMYLVSRVCVEVPAITLLTRDGTRDFNVTVKSRLIDAPPAHIRSDRYVWFDNK